MRILPFFTLQHCIRRCVFDSIHSTYINGNGDCLSMFRLVSWAGDRPSKARLHMEFHHPLKALLKANFVSDLISILIALHIQSV